ncbi:MAG: hypothetical protein HY092_04295 [Candidatus Kerfeldbacteria bacterium]|nr:hypothetical protein [Candidatus Kerfeldbacteria bacterium]
MRLIDQPISKEDLKRIARERFGDMVKAVVDLRQGIMALGSEMHADAEQMLLERGAKQADLWGINIYPDQSADQWIEFDSMINIRPSQGNRSRSVENEATQKQIIEIVQRLIT